tara:strand:+ start:462 stop:917 length:456 start_codon:yes stop_codon:yes gene_type:complete
MQTNKDKFIIKDEYSFELYPCIKEEVILDALLKECIDYKLSKEVQLVLIESWNSRFWVDKGYDGATIIKNKKHPSIANFFHDYHYRCGQGDKKADIIYRELLKLTGYSKSTANKRYKLIRVFGSYFRVRHKLKGNVNKPSFDTLELYHSLK